MKKTMQEMMEGIVSDRNEIIRYTINDTTIKESVNVTAQYGFVAYRGTKEHVGSIDRGKLKGLSKVVNVEGFGLIIYRIVTFGDEQEAYDYDMGFLSARNYEIHFILNVLSRIPIIGLNEVVEFVREESAEWEESFDQAAKKELRKDLGLHNYNPFNQPAIPPKNRRGVDV